MKKKILIIGAITSLLLNVLFLSSGFRPEESQDGLAKVEKQSGVELYLYSEPLKKYDVIGTCGDAEFLHMGSLHIEDFVNHIVKKLVNQNVDKHIDGILYNGGNTASAIRFK